MELPIQFFPHPKNLVSPVPVDYSEFFNTFTDLQDNVKTQSLLAHASGFV